MSGIARLISTPIKMMADISLHTGKVLTPNKAVRTNFSKIAIGPSAQWTSSLIVCDRGVCTENLNSDVMVMKAAEDPV